MDADRCPRPEETDSVGTMSFWIARNKTSLATDDFDEVFDVVREWRLSDDRDQGGGLWLVCPAACFDRLPQDGFLRRPDRDFLGDRQSDLVEAVFERSAVLNRAQEKTSVPRSVIQSHDGVRLGDTGVVKKRDPQRGKVFRHSGKRACIVGIGLRIAGNDPDHLAHIRPILHTHAFLP